METYLSEVLHHIESVKIKKVVEKELRYHLQKTKEYWIENGFSEQVAEERAVRWEVRLSLGMKWKKCTGLK